jgi:hypothetical protein
MPDELYISTRVDTSGLASGMAQAEAVVTASLDQLKANYKAAQDAVKAATTNMAQAEQQFAAFVQQGNQQAIAAVKQYENELKQAQAAEQAAATQIQRYNSTLLEEVAVTNQAATAQEKLAAATAHVVPEFAAASAAVRTLDGNLSVRAAERFLTTTLQLGPALQAAFPIFGALAMVDVLEQMVGKFVDLEHSIDGVYQAQQAYIELSKQLDKEFKNEVEHAAQLTAEYNRLAHGPLFEFKEKYDNARLAAAAYGREIDSLTAKQAALQERIARGTTVNTRAGKSFLNEDAQVAVVEMEGVQKRMENVRLAQQNAEKEAQVATAEIHKQETADAEKAAREQERIAREHEAAVRKVVEAFQRGQREALASLIRLNREYEAEQGRHAGEELAAASKRLEADTKSREEQLKVGIERLQGAHQVAEGELAIQVAHIEQMATLGRISRAEEARQLADYHKAQIAEEIDYWERIARIYQAGGAAMVKEYEQALNRLSQLRQQLQVEDIKGQTAITKAEEDELKKREASIRSFIRTVDQQFFNHLNEWIRGQITFAEAMKESWNDLVMDVIIQIEKMIAKQIEEKLVAEALKLLGLDTGSQAAKAAAEAATNMALAQSNVSVASTDALLKTIAAVANPFVGVPLGIAMGEAVKTAGETMITVPAFAKGGIVPDTTLALLHPNEMVLPATLSTFIQNSATHATSNSARLNYAPVIHGGSNMSSLQFKTMLDQHADHVGRIMRQQVKTFNRA